MELNVEREHAHRSRCVHRTVLLVAVLASCKESTAPPTESARTVAPVAASILAIGGTTLTDTVCAVETLIVYVVDGSGGPVSGVSVSFSIGASRGSVSPSVVLTDQAGRATTKWTLGTKDGRNGDIDSVVAVTRTPILSIARYAKVTAGAPAALKILTGDSQAGFFSLAVPVRPTVTAVDRYGNSAAFLGTDITFAVSAGGGSFSGGCCTAGALPSNTNAVPIPVQPRDDWLLGDGSTIQTLIATFPGATPVAIRATAAAAPFPASADWAQAAAQIAAIAVDAFEQAAAPPSGSAKRGRVGGGTLSLRQLPSRASAQLNIAPTFTASYMCCNPGAVGAVFARSVGVVNVTGETSTTLDASGSGSISLTENITEGAASETSTCFANCDLPLTATHALALPTPGLTVSGVLPVVNGVVGAVQQLRLTGSVNYYSGAGKSPTASSVDVTFAYSDFPRQPASSTGQFGVALTGSPLPNIAAPNRADLSAYPTLMSTADVGVLEQYDYYGPPGTTNTVPTGLFWTDLYCYGPLLTATGGDMSNVTVTGSVVWPSISPGYVPIPLPMPTQVDLAAGDHLYLPSGDESEFPNETLLEVWWGYLGALPSGTRVPWTAIYQVSYTVKSTGQKANYSLAYSCK